MLKSGRKPDLSRYRNRGVGEGKSISESRCKIPVESGNTSKIKDLCITKLSIGNTSQEWAWSGRERALLLFVFFLHVIRIFFFLQQTHITL